MTAGLAPGVDIWQLRPSRRLFWRGRAWKRLRMNLLKLLRLAPGPFRGTPHACTVLTAETQRPAIRKLNSDAQPAPVRIAVSGEGKRLEAVWGSGSPPSTYHSVWLRHNCQCSQCLSSHGQNTVSSTGIDPNVAVADANITGMR